MGIFYSSRGRVIRIGDGHTAYFPLLRNTVARKVVRLARLLGGMEAKYQAVRSAKQISFFIELPLPRGMEESFCQLANKALPEASCDRKALLRGVFMGCGSVNAPTARYHLELVVPTTGWVACMTRLLQDNGLRAGVTERAGHHVIYLKDGDGIVRALSLMGASRAVMEFENARVVREVSGQVNRRLNFETANIDKTVSSVMRQMAAIESLQSNGRLEALPPALREMARARQAHAELNLSELAGRLSLSKSAVNHRLRRLVELAEANGRHQNGSAPNGKANGVGPH